MSTPYVSLNGPQNFSARPNNGGPQPRAAHAAQADPVRFLASFASYGEALAFKGTGAAREDGRTAVIFQSLLAEDPSQRSRKASGQKGPFYLAFPQGRPNKKIRRGKGVLTSISFDVLSIANALLDDREMLFKSVIRLMKDFSQEEPPGRS